MISQNKYIMLLLLLEVVRPGLAAGLFPLSLLWSLDSGKLICCHLAYCPCYLRWSGLSWATVRVSSTVLTGQMEDLHLQRAWKNTRCDLLSYTNAVGISQCLEKKVTWGTHTQHHLNSYYFISLICWSSELYNIVPLRKPEKNRPLIEHLNCHANVYIQIT